MNDRSTRENLLRRASIIENAAYVLDEGHRSDLEAFASCTPNEAARFASCSGNRDAARFASCSPPTDRVSRFASCSPPMGRIDRFASCSPPDIN